MVAPLPPVAPTLCLPAAVPPLPRPSLPSLLNPSARRLPPPLPPPPPVCPAPTRWLLCPRGSPPTRWLLCPRGSPPTRWLLCPRGSPPTRWLLCPRGSPPTRLVSMVSTARASHRQEGAGQRLGRGVGRQRGQRRQCRQRCAAAQLHLKGHGAFHFLARGRETCPGILTSCRRAGPTFPATAGSGLCAPRLRAQGAGGGLHCPQERVPEVRPEHGDNLVSGQASTLRRPQRQLVASSGPARLPAHQRRSPCCALPSQSAPMGGPAQQALQRSS